MINQENLYLLFEEASKPMPPSRMSAEEIQARSLRLHHDTEYLEHLYDVWYNKKMAQSVLISECIVGIELLDLYTKKVPRSGAEPLRFLKKEYVTRLSMFKSALNTLISRVQIEYTPHLNARMR